METGVSASSRRLRFGGPKRTRFCGPEPDQTKGKPAKPLRFDAQPGRDQRSHLLGRASSLRISRSMLSRSAFSLYLPLDPGSSLKLNCAQNGGQPAQGGSAG